MSRFGRLWERFARVTPLRAHHLYLDFGSVSTKCVAGPKQLWRIPTCVTYQPSEQAVITWGDKALGLQGKTGENIKTEFPVTRGVIRHPQLAQAYLEALVAHVRHHTAWEMLSPLNLHCVYPAQATPMEKATFQEVLTQAGAQHVQLISKPQAILARLKRPAHTQASLIAIDIGGNTIEVCFFVGQEIVLAKTLQIGGEEYTTLVQDLVRTKHNCLISHQTAEKVKISVGLLTPWDKEYKIPDKKMVVRGKDLITNLPLTAQVSSQDLGQAFQTLTKELITEMKAVFSQAPAELVASSLENGIFFSGGGSLLSGLGGVIASELRSQACFSPTPYDDIVLGLQDVT
ncbi:MAG TPA: rod shape-determining protein [Vitreimonas sp.]|nr:rod shape-determining protein [Vitreimonas sp.]